MLAAYSADEVGPGKWSAYRKGHELLKRGETAIFATCEEAKRAADAHLYAGEGHNTEKTKGGFAWAR